METAAAMEWVTVVAYVTLAAIALRVRSRHGGTASSWLALTFGVLAVAVVLGLVDDAGLSPFAQRVHSTVITSFGLAFPYLLFRFASTFRPPSRWASRFALWGWVILTVTRPLTPIEPVLGESLRTVLYTAAAMIYWTWLSTWVVVRLWQRSGDQAAVARRRLRGMATAAAVLNLAILAIGFGGGGAIATLATQLLALFSAALFLLGFAPPRIVRWLWRREDEQKLHAAEQRLGGAIDAREVAEIVVPAAARLFGGTVALLDGDGALLAGDDRLRGARRPHVKVPSGELVADGAVLQLGLRHGLLVVEASPYTPFFGEEEISLLRGIGTAVDLALGRVHLSERERIARYETEQTNAELEALLYGISHDLRTPLVALTGYVDILSEDPATEDQPYILERIRANTEYMDALIRDLLELSRIGRIDERTEDVDLGRLAKELAAEIERANPGAEVRVGDLPVARLPAIRARQLLTNLLQNAVRHAGRPDLTIQIRSVEEDGETVISVSDDGVGIPIEHRDRVFGIFERLQGRDERTGGTGVGLSMCRKIVEGAGGRIWVEEGPSRGAAIRFVLPGASTHASLHLEAQQ